MDRYDVLIVGGGPIGSAVGRWAAEAGYSVAIFEEHEHIGSPLHCAGLVTDRAFSLPQLPQDSLVLNTITGAQIFSPMGGILRIGGDRPHALVIDRVRYDQAIAQEATAAGAMLFTGEKISAARQDSDGVRVESTTTSVAGRILVGADGARSRIRSLFGFPQPAEYLEGVGGEITGLDLDPQTVLLFTGARVAPGFFAWVIPMNPDGTKARVGLCKIKGASPSMHECFEALLRRPMLAHGSLECRYGGLVPLGAVEPSVLGRVMLVGDAAAQVKPTSGGGIVTGLLCARQCARTIVEALGHPVFSVQDLVPYQSRWKRVVGRELSWGMAFRRYYRGVGDEVLESWFRELRKPRVAAAISRHGDIDYPSRMVLPVLAAAPWLTVRLPGVLKARRAYRRRDEGGGGT